MKHPFSSLVINKKGTLLFATVQNNIVVYDLSTHQLLDKWTDTVGTDFVIKKKFEKIIDDAKKQQEIVPEKAEEISSNNDMKESEVVKGEKIEENASKKQKLNNSKVKIPKIPTPGPGAPQIYNDIRNLYLTESEKLLIATTNSDKAAIIFKLDSETHSLELIKRQPFPKRPCSVAVSADETKLILGDKFGDVYCINIEGPIIEDLGESSLQETNEKKLPAPILGHVSMLTNLMMTQDSNGKEKIITADRDEHLRVSSFPNSYVIDRFCFGHREFVSELAIPSFNPSILISGGGDEFLLVWDWMTSSKPIQKVNLREHVEPFLTDAHLIPERWCKTDEDKKRKEFCIADLAIDESSHKLIVLIEQTKILLVFKFNSDNRTLEFERLIEDEDTITCMDVDSINKTIYYGVESKENLVKAVSTGTFSITNFEIDSSVEVEDEKNIYPLYNIGQLRKRSEH